MELKELAELLLRLQAVHPTWKELWNLFNDCPGNAELYQRIGRMQREGRSLLDDLRAFLKTKKAAA